MINCHDYQDKELPIIIVIIRMLYQIGVVIVTVLALLKILSITVPALQTKKSYMKLVNYGFTDRICRIVQYVASGFEGDIDRRLVRVLAFLKIEHLKFIVELERLATFMSNIRKGLRFLRSPALLYEVVNHYDCNTKHQKFTLKWLQNWFQFLGDVTDLGFYFTDHFFAFYLLGIVHNEDLNTHLEFVGHIMWIANAFFLFFVAVFKTIDVKRNESNANQIDSKLRSYYIEFLSQSIEFVLGFCFIYPHLMRREAISLITIISSVAKIVQFRYK